MSIKRFWKSIFYKDSGLIEVPNQQPSIGDVLKMLSDASPNSVVKFVAGHTDGYGDNKDPIPSGYFDVEIFKGDEVRALRIPYQHIGVLESVTRLVHDMEQSK